MHAPPALGLMWGPRPKVVSQLSVLSGRRRGQWEIGVERGRGPGHLATRGRIPSPRSPICRVNSEKVWCDRCPPSMQKGLGLGFDWLSDPQVIWVDAGARHWGGLEFAQLMVKILEMRLHWKVCLGCQRARRPGSISTLCTHTSFSRI